MRAYCPHSPMVGTGWLEGWRLTFAGEDVIGWEGAVTTMVESPGDRVFVALYDVHPYDAAPARRDRGRDRRHVPQAARAGLHPRRRRDRLGLRLRRLRGRPADLVVPVGDRERRREGGRARTTTSPSCGPAPPAPRRRSAVSHAASLLPASTATPVGPDRRRRSHTGAGTARSYMSVHRVSRRPTDAVERQRGGRVGQVDAQAGRLPALRRRSRRRPGAAAPHPPRAAGTRAAPPGSSPSPLSGRAPGPRTAARRPAPRRPRRRTTRPRRVRSRDPGPPLARTTAARGPGCRRKAVVVDPVELAAGRPRRRRGPAGPSRPGGGRGSAGRSASERLIRTYRLTRVNPASVSAASQSRLRREDRASGR